MSTMVIFWLTLFPFLSLFNPPYKYQGNATHLPKILQECYRLKNNMCQSITESPFSAPENTVSQLHFNKIYVLREKKRMLQTICVLLLLLSRFSHVRLCATPKMAAHQAPLSQGFSRQEHWSGFPFPSPMHESEK